MRFRKRNSHISTGSSSVSRVQNRLFPSSKQDLENCFFHPARTEAAFRFEVNGQKPRTLFVKQDVDVFGSYTSFKWNQETAQSIIRKFPYKPTYWEMICYLEADWAIIKTTRNDEFTRYVKQWPHLIELIKVQQSSSVPDDSIDFSGYDIVISFEPCLPATAIGKFSRTTRFFYFFNEHAHHLYNDHITSPARGYEALLDHMCGSTVRGKLSENRAISFPYLRDPTSMRSTFPSPKRAIRNLWIESRTIMQAATGSSEGLWSEACSEYLHSLVRTAPIPILSRPKIYTQFYNALPIEAQDGMHYLEDLSKAYFFVGLAAAGAGQTLCDAASLGLICFGSDRLPYHRMVCHPDNLCNDIAAAVERASMLAKDEARSNFYRAYQDQQIRTHMQRAPLRRLLYHF